MTQHLKQKLMTVTTMMVILTFSIPAVAGQNRKGPKDCNNDFGQKRHHMGYSMLWNNPDVIKELGLSDDQVKKIKDIDFSFREKRLKEKAGLDQYRLELQKGFSAEPVEKSSVLKTAQKMAEIKGEMFVQQIECRLDVEKLLTPDQAKKMNTYKRQHFGKYGDWKHRNEYGRGRNAE